MRMSRPLILASAIVLTGVGTSALAPTAARAQAAGQAEDKKVTLNLKDVPLRNAIDLLFAGSGLQYAIDPNVPNVPVNLSIRDVPLTQALRLIVRQAAVGVPGLTNVRDGEIYTIRIRQAPPVTQPTSGELPPEQQDNTAAELVPEKIPIQFNSVQVLAFAGLVQGVIPTEGQLMGGGMMGGGMGGGMMGGGMGGMGGGMMGGMGGMGGGMMGGMGGMMGGMGGMGGGMGGMGGGMGGMMGGMGGGMGGMGGGGLGGFGGGGMGGMGGGGMGGMGGGGRRF